MYGTISNNRILNLCTIQLDGMIELPEGANVGDYYHDDKIYTPPNNYSVLASVKDGVPSWAVDTEAQKAEIDVLRCAAYREESDPIFFKEQRGEVDSGTWAAKVAEIKAKYPKIPA